MHWMGQMPLCGRAAWFVRWERLRALLCAGAPQPRVPCQPPGISSACPRRCPLSGRPQPNRNSNVPVIVSGTRPVASTRTNHGSRKAHLAACQVLNMARVLGPLGRTTRYCGQSRSATPACKGEPQRWFVGRGNAWMVTSGKRRAHACGLTGQPAHMCQAKA